MNKLISKNPILRFKLGRKIMKCLGGNYIQIDSENDIWLDKSTGKQYQRNWRGRRWNRTPQGTAEGDFSNYFSEYSSTPKMNDPKLYSVEDIKALYTEPNTAKRRDYKKGEVEYAQRNGVWYARWTDPTRPNLGYYRVAEGSTGYNRAGDHNVLRNGQWVKIDETPAETVRNISTPSYQFGKMGGWNRSMGSSIDQDSLNMLLEMGYNIDNIDARTIQNDINKAFGSNAVKADNRWGNLSRAGLKALYENWKISQPSTTETKPTITQTPEFLEGLRQQFIKEETPEQLTDRAIVNNVDNLQFKRNGNYNKSGIRDLIRNYGLRAYDFTGALRKALRQYLNGESNDTSLLTNGLERFIVPYKQGGQLPSRNIVKRFKNRKFN